VEEFEVGRSVMGEAIRGFRMGAGSEVTLFLGVHHGNEPLGRPLLERLMTLLETEPQHLERRTAVFVPVLNPDGLAAGTRQNARGVDLNRNLPTRDWAPSPDDARYAPGPEPASEPETRALVSLVDSLRPLKIVTLHAPLMCVNFNGLDRTGAADLPSPAPRRRMLDGQVVVCAEDLGEAMARHNGYPLVGDIGYPCPGSFGTWAGHERRIATITLELGRESDLDRAWLENRDALLEALDY